MSTNVFMGKTHAELRAMMAEQLNLILGNHVTTVAIQEGRLATCGILPDDILVDGNLVDKAGALLNGALAHGYSFGALRWTRELCQDADPDPAGPLEDLDLVPGQEAPTLRNVTVWCAEDVSRDKCEEIRNRIRLAQSEPSHLITNFFLTPRVVYPEDRICVLDVSADDMDYLRTELTKAWEDPAYIAVVPYEIHINRRNKR